jgi:hypothetical protein
MPPALIIANLIVTHGIPLATAIVEKWSKDEPANPTPAEWLALLKSPSLTLTYDQQMAAAAKRNSAAAA